MITRDATLKYRNLLGHYKEDNAVRLRFDLTGFEKDFPGGKVRCFAQRHGETTRYPVELTIDDNSAYWTVTESDVSIPGNGRCELEWRVDDTVVKSEIYGTMVLDSLKDGSEPPDAAGKAWYEKIEAEIGNLDDLETEAKDDLVSAINEAAKAELPTPSAENVGKIPVSKQVGDGYKYVMEDKSTSDLSLGLTGASVGQVPVVESVDTQGKPTAWKPSSAPGILSVTISPSDNPDEFTCDKTNAEIYEAFSAGKIVICDFIGQSRMQCVEAGAEYAVFLAISSGNGAASVNGVDISMNGDTQTVYVRDEVMLVAVPSSPDNAGRLITFDMMGAPFITQFNGLLYGEQDGSVTSLGVVTEDDNGKFLRVVDGMWQAVTVDNANGVSF